MSRQTDIQVYGDKYILEDASGVYITNVDVSQVVHEMPVEDVLEALEFEDIVSYVTRVRSEVDEGEL